MDIMLRGVEIFFLNVTEIIKDFMVESDIGFIFYLWKNKMRVASVETEK